MGASSKTYVMFSTCRYETWMVKDLSQMMILIGSAASHSGYSMPPSFGTTITKLADF